MREYTVILEQGKDADWGTYALDLPGLGVVAETRAEVLTLISEGISLHIAGLIEDGLPIPEPASYAEMITVDAA